MDNLYASMLTLAAQHYSEMRHLKGQHKSEHRGQTFRCTLAEGGDCINLFTDLGSLRAHVCALHKQIRRPPVAEEMGCTGLLSAMHLIQPDASRDFHGRKQHQCDANKHKCAPRRSATPNLPLFNKL